MKILGMNAGVIVAVTLCTHGVPLRVGVIDVDFKENSGASRASVA